MLVVLAVEARRRYVMSVIPVLVDEASVISVVHSDLFFGQAIARGILEISICHIDQLVYVLAAQRGFTV